MGLGKVTVLQLHSKGWSGINVKAALSPRYFKNCTETVSNISHSDVKLLPTLYVIYVYSKSQLLACL